MCGIVGVVRFNGQPVDVPELEAMQATLRHRGPDGEGLWQTRAGQISVGLAHRRLAIIDLSETGRQPMASPDGQLCITYNGEVYNYVELREELTQLGHRFVGQSDTEVLLRAYQQWGEACLSRLNGMFAFAIWDARRKALFCARDRLGIKPFYYVWRASVFGFASEIKALLRMPHVRADPDPEAVYDYLSLGLMHHGARTFFAEVRQLPAGSFMWVNGTQPSATRYWDLSGQPRATRADFDVEALRTLLGDAVRLRLRSDVPVGVLLSGGLDSSSVTVLAAKHHPASLQAFSLEFDEVAFDESSHARLVASRSNAVLRLLRPQGRGVWEELEDLIRAQDAPTHAPEVYSNWCMMRAVATCDVKVLLSGQGGDELFAGYNWYPKHLLVSLLRQGKFLAWWRELWHLPGNFPSGNTKSRLLLVAWMLQALLPLGVKRYLKPELRAMDSILRPAFRRRMRERDAANMRWLDPPGLEEKMQHDLLICNVPQYLRYEDANAMAFGIEERVPMLDYRLVEWAHGLAVSWKVRGGVTKHALRQAMGGLLPEEILRRRDKMGLSAPRDAWFRGELRTPIEQLFASDCRMYGEWVDREAFRVQLQRYLDGQPTPLARLLWRCINLEKWLACYTG